ncbi:hypothetical protein BD779DRAFT_1785035 [Infundibulicybe gibba]|nr:hypothetical protein BD779DRAFT_1785035 [Infundibulicybe gibba]
MCVVHGGSNLQLGIHMFMMADFHLKRGSIMGDLSFIFKSQPWDPTPRLFSKLSCDHRSLLIFGTGVCWSLAPPLNSKLSLGIGIMDRPGVSLPRGDFQTGPPTSLLYLDHPLELIQTRWKRAVIGPKAHVPLNQLLLPALIMASHSPQRPRKPQAHPSNQGMVHGVQQPRETSRSPSLRDRPRTIKAQSMPMVPAVTQMYPGSNPPQTSPQDITPPPPQHSHSQPNVNTHYPRPINRVQPPQFLNYRNGEPWEMTDELLADIERADLQQAQSHVHPSNTYMSGYPRGESASPPKDPGVERVRASERTSPKDMDPSQQLRRPREQASRESPKGRDRQPTSPTTAAFQSQSPERRMSPPSYTVPLGSPGEHPGNYATYSRDSPPVLRRANTDARPPNSNSLATQTPPLQAINSRTPDRSLPVQEEPEDDLASSSKKIASPREREVWKGEHISEGNSPRYEGHNSGRDSRSGHREQHEQDDSEKRRDSFTPRSPTAGLPDAPPDKYYTPQNSNTHKPAPKAPQAYQQIPASFLDPRVARGQLYPPEVHPEDLQYLEDPASAFYQAYIRSPRPDAPIPPTPHSQTAAPSPSPMLSGMLSGMYGAGKDMPPFSPVAPVGSPYPYPFSHVRRNQSYSGHPNRPQIPSTLDPNHPNNIQEQLARQWQVFAQNNHGNMTDSTFSPSSTPFQGAGYNPWAFLHTNRTIGRIHDARSLQSSPSHEPLPLPTPPNVGLKKKDRTTNLRPRGTSRKPPPRVESTQPRETSPEPSSSGEETAGEEHFAAMEGSWTNGGSATLSVNEDNSDWVNEDEEEDDEDLLDLNTTLPLSAMLISGGVSGILVGKTSYKHLNKWPYQFQMLDRQTDATMVLLAAPSHSTKLHSIKSRSIRRQSALKESPTLLEMRAGFRRIAAQRRSTRSYKSSLVDRFLINPGNSSGDGSDVSSESREGDLKRALGAALGSLGELNVIYEQREARWIEEMRRIDEDRERVALLLRQALGEKNSTSGFGRGP